MPYNVSSTPQILFKLLIKKKKKTLQMILYTKRWDNLALEKLWQHLLPNQRKIWGSEDREL